MAPRLTTIRPPPHLRVEFRYPRLRPGALRAPEAHTFLFDADQVRDLVAHAHDLGRSLQWVMAGTASLEVVGSSAWRVQAIGSAERLADRLKMEQCSPARTSAHAAHAAIGCDERTGFRVILPFVDLHRLLAHPDGARLLAIRHAGDECWLACITTSGAVQSIRHNPLDVLREADDLLLEVLSMRACADAAVRVRIEDYLRERHLIS